VVAFSLRTGEMLVGWEAKDQAVANPKNTITDAKRFIGRSYDEVSKELQNNVFGFEIVDRDNKVLIKVEPIDGKPILLEPFEVSSFILSHLKKTAEKWLGKDVKNVVLAVPVEFTKKQREITKKAAEKAGLDVWRMISEPTAAAMAYDLHLKTNINLIIVYDFGGGTLDVVLLSLENRIFKVIARHGDKFLGGEDFNHRTMHYFIDLFKTKYKKDIYNDKFLLQELRNEVERTKIELSSSFESTLQMKSLGIEEKITREMFEKINAPLFDRSIVPVEQVLKDTDIPIENVDEIVLVGGSTRLPKVRQMLEDFFKKKAKHIR